MDDQKTKLNGVGKARLIEISFNLEQQLKEALGSDDVSKYRSNIADASVAILQIEQIVAEQSTVIFDALVSMCDAQDVIEKSMRERAEKNPSGFLEALGFKKAQG